MTPISIAFPSGHDRPRRALPRGTWRSGCRKTGRDAELPVKEARTFIKDLVKGELKSLNDPNH